MALIKIEEVKELATKHIPKIAQAHPGIKMLLQFVGKAVHAINHLDDRLRVVEAALKGPTPAASTEALEEKSDA